MKILKSVIVIISMVFLVGCKKETMTLALNEETVYSLDNATSLVVNFTLDEDKNIMFIAEANLLDEIILYDSDGENVDTVKANKDEQLHWLTMTQSLDAGDYQIEVLMEEKTETDIALMLYEQQTTEHNIDLDTPFEDDHLPYETKIITLTISEEGFYDFSQGHSYGYTGKLNLSVTTEAQANIYKDLYHLGTYRFYLEPGSYELYLTHWQDYSYGTFNLTVSKSNTLVGSPIDNDFVHGTIESLSQTYHLLSIEEEGIYTIDFGFDFTGHISLYPIDSPKNASTLGKLDGRTSLMYSTVYKESNTFYFQVEAGEYWVVISGSRGSEYGDYTLSLNPSSISLNTTIHNEGTAFDMLPFSEQSPPSLITLEITEAGPYQITYDGNFEATITMYNTNDSEDASLHYDFIDNTLITDLAIGTYIIEVDNYLYYDSGLVKVLVEKEE